MLFRSGREICLVESFVMHLCEIAEEVFCSYIGQPLVNKLSPYMRLSTQIVLGILIFASSFFFLIFAHNLVEFVVDFVILTIGETLSFAGLPAWITQLTGTANAGHYQGLYNIVISVGRAIGPLYGGYIIAVSYTHLDVYKRQPPLLDELAA